MPPILFLYSAQLHMQKYTDEETGKYYSKINVLTSVTVSKHSMM